ncbi:MAG: hypothetical protein GC186_13240 [Rhodobacteraceae bacterium]|nr:hypothetical protein [Paracoccaceae bacterium]
MKSSLIAALLMASVAIPAWADSTDGQPSGWHVVTAEQLAQQQAQQSNDTTKRKIKVVRLWSFGVLH